MENLCQLTTGAVDGAAARGCADRCGNSDSAVVGPMAGSIFDGLVK